MRTYALTLLALVSGGQAQTAHAKDHRVQMLTKGAAGMMVFEPAFTQVAVGDTITFIPTDKSHNAESIANMIPAGATPFKGKINQQVTVRFDKAGLYAFKCLPHAGMGMVGLVQAGGATNKAQLQVEATRLPGLAKRRMAELLSQVR